MRFNIKKIKDKQYLQLIESKYDKKTKKPRSIIIKSYGEVSKLKEKYDDPIEYFKKIAQEEIEKNKKEKAITVRFKNVYAQKFYKLEKNEKLFNNTMFIGHVFWSVFYHKLELDKLFKNIGSKYNIDFSVNDVMKFLIYTRINFLVSKRDSLYYRNSMGEDYNFDDFDIYKVNKIISENKDIIMKWIYLKLPKIYKYNLKLTHYNLTKYSMSMEGNIPLGMLIDKNNMPIDYKVFPDDSCIENFLEKYNLKKLVTTSEMDLNNKSFIIKHPVKKLSKDLKHSFETLIKPNIEKIRKENPDLGYVYFPIKLTNINKTFIFQYYNKSKRKQAYILDKEISKSTKLLKKFDPAIDNTCKEILANPLIDDSDEDNGYSLLVTDLSELSNSDIIKVYREQDLISKIFKMSKSDIFSKPVKGSKEISIDSHFLVCFICMLFIKLMQYKLNYKYSVDDILISTKNLFYIKIDENNFILNGFNTCLVDIENKLFGKALLYNMATPSRIKNYFSISKNI